MSHDPRCTGYQARRKARRAQIKDLLLPILQRHEARGERPDMAALATAFGCGASTLRQMRHELGKAGLIEAPEAIRQREVAERIDVPDLAQRVAAVREAKRRVGELHRRGKPGLTDEELDEVLPP